MSKRTLFLLLPLLVAFTQPAPAFWDEAVSAFKSTPAHKQPKGKKDKKKEAKGEPSAWDKLLADANKTTGSDKKEGKDKSDWDKLSEQADKDLKDSEKDKGNADTPSWDEIKDRAGKAMEEFAKDGKGFDIMSRVKKMKRKVEKLAADETSALTGRFYDLKQPVDKKAKPLRREQVVRFIKNYMDSDWDQEMLDMYYSPNVELVAPYLYLPRCKASYAPKAFRCNEGEQERTVEPMDWLVVYSGKVKAPKTGHFRFVGMGDDAIVVRFDEKVVLESGWSIPSEADMVLGTKRQYQDYISSPKGGCALYQYKETPHWNQQLGGIQTGSKFHVKEGETYPIQIIVSEIPGNEFGFCLLIEELETGKAPTGKYKVGDAPVVHIFRTNETQPDLKEIEEALTKEGDYRVGCTLEIPPFLEDSPVWEVESDEERRSIVERAASTMDDEEDTAMGRRKERRHRHGHKKHKGKETEENEETEEDTSEETDEAEEATPEHRRQRRRFGR